MTMPARAHVLIVDDEPSVLETIAAILRLEGYGVIGADSVEAALAELRRRRFELVLTDLRLEEGSGLSLIAELQRHWPDTVAVMLTGYASLESAVDALRKGAYDYLIKPCNVDELKATVARATERALLSRALHDRLAELDAANAKLQSFSQELQRRVDQATAELSQKVEELAEAKQRLETAQRERERFISMIAHELGGPLTAISGFAQLLARPGITPTMSERARRSILSETRRLARLVKDLEDVTRLASGSFDLEYVEADVVEIVRQQAELARVSSDAHRIVLDVPPGPVPLRVDRDRLAQVLANLLGNAIKYSDGGEIRVTLEVDGGHARLSVRDQGPGIPQDMLEAIFEPRVRLVAGEGDQPKGAGLGLYIARGIVQAHGGQIWAESSPGAGASFTLVLPLDPSREPPDAMVALGFGDRSGRRTATERVDQHG